MTKVDSDLQKEAITCRDNDQNLHVTDQVQVFQILYANESLLCRLNIQGFDGRVSQRLPVTGRHAEASYGLRITVTYGHTDNILTAHFKVNQAAV